MTGGMTLTHEQAQALIHKGLEARLDEFERAAVASHLADCANCAAYAAEMRAADRRLAESLPERWPERRYTTAELNSRLASIKTHARREAMMKQVSFFVRLAGAAAALVILVVGLAWLVRGSTWQQRSEPAGGATPTTDISGCPHPRYLVQPGDTLNDVAGRYGVTRDAIKQQNHLSGDEIAAGQVLEIPACAAQPAATPSPLVVTQVIEEGRVPLEQAEQTVKDWIFANNPDMNPQVTFPLKEITTAEVWQRMHVQVFKVTQDAKQDEGFVLRGRDVFPIGIAFGGTGVTQLLVTDLDGDGNPEMIFAYNFGSGIHQSAVGMFTVKDGQVFTPETSHLGYLGDLTLEKTDDRTVVVSGMRQGLAEPEKLGQLRWGGVGKTLILAPAGETLTTYTSPGFGVSFQYPQNWQPDGEESYRSENGFFTLSLQKQGAEPQDLSRVCELETNSSPAVYGDQPELTMLAFDDRHEACLIRGTATGPDARSAVLFMPDGNRIARLAIDTAHVQLVASSLRFTQPMPTEAPVPIDMTPRAPDPQARITTQRLGELTESEYPVVSADVDTPGHMEFLARIPNGVYPFQVFPALGQWYDSSQDLELARTNNALEPFGYRIAMRKDASENRFDLYRGSEKIKAALSMFFPVSAYHDEQGGGDFALVVQDAESKLWLVRKDSIEPWDEMLHHDTRPVIGSGGRLITVERDPSDASGATDRAVIKQDGQAIFTYTLTPFMVEEPVKKLGEWNGGWVLEVNGTLIVNGAIYNQKDFPADEIFNWTLLNGKPFFFFRRGGKTGAWYNGQELAVQYDEIIHGKCCESAAFNVVTSPDALWFHARKDGMWYYVEIKAGK